MNCNSSWIDLVSLLVSIGGFGLASYALWKSSNSSSAATLVALQSGFSGHWDNLRQAIRDENDASRNFHLGELLNFFEISCGIVNEGTLTGKSEKLISKYVCRCFALLDKSAYLDQMEALAEGDGTFDEIRKFISCHDNIQFLNRKRRNTLCGGEATTSSDDEETNSSPA